MKEIVWGTYRPIKEFHSVLSMLQDAEITAIDTAPNYAGGKIERSLGALGSKLRLPVFSKVGYTHGDDRELVGLSDGARHCLSPEYVLARIQRSCLRTFPLGGQFECIFIHNPEHVFEHEVTDSLKLMDEACKAFKDAYDAGYFQKLGVATWSVSPFSDQAHRIAEVFEKNGLLECLGYWMHPISATRRELLVEALFKRKVRVPGDWKLLGSAPFAGGEALNLLGPRFSKVFAGNQDPVAQSLSLARAINAIPVCGVGSVAHADRLLTSWAAGIPSSDLATEFVKIVDEL